MTTTFADFPATVLAGDCLVLRSVPGAGKSTLLDRVGDELARRNVALYVASADQFRMVGGVYTYDPTKNEEVHRACARRFIRLAVEEEGRPSVLAVDNTNITPLEIVPYLAVAKAFGWRPRVVTVTIDPEVAARRNVHNVPPGKVAQMAERLAYYQTRFPSGWPTETVEGES